jgi:hypothetical protein
MPEKNASKATSPPADAPIPTIGKGCSTIDRSTTSGGGVFSGTASKFFSFGFRLWDDMIFLFMANILTE